MIDKERLKETFILFSSTIAGIRYRNRMKLKFLQYLRNDLETQGHKCLIWEEKRNGLKLYNLVVGNLFKAKKIVVAGYDTPSHILLANFLYYPIDSKRNRKSEKKDILAKSTISLILISLGIIVLNRIPSFSIILKTFGIIIFAVLLYFSFSLTRGFANFYNFNKNSGAIAILYELVCQLDPKDENIAIVFLDQVATSYVGYFHLKEILKEKRTSTEIIILDCVAVGTTTFLVSDVNHKYLVDRLEKYYESPDKSTILLDKNEREKTPLSFFQNAVCITCGESAEKNIIVRNTRSNKDVEYDLEKMENIANCLFKYCLNK